MGEPILSKNLQGSTHGFLQVRSADGRAIAVGELIQVAHGREVRSRLIFRFRDGSIDDDVTVYEQGATYRLISDHHVQKGPSFPKPMDLAIDARTGETISREMKDGKEEVKNEHVDVPDDLANGLVPLALAAIAPGMQEMKVSYLTGTPKPRVVKLAIAPLGQDSFRVAGIPEHAKKYNVHIELGGVAGVIAPIIGKQPEDLQIWVTEGEVAMVIKMMGPFYNGGPSWTTEQTVATWGGVAPRAK